MILIVFIVLLAGQAFAAGAPVRIDDGDTMTDQADLTVSSTATLVKASNSNRAALNCTTTDVIRWGTSSVTASRGQRVGAGASISIRNTGAIYMIAESADSTVSCTEESYSSSTGNVFSP